MTRLTAVLGVALALAIPAPAPAAFGDRDCSFGNAGTQTVSGAFGPMFDAVGEPGGTTLVRMGFLSTGSILYRIDANGTTSTSIGSNANAGLRDPLEVLLSDGRILFTTGCGASNCSGGGVPSGSAPAGVGRFLAAGGLDPSFGTNGYATLTHFNIASSGPMVLSDGRIVVGGSYTGNGDIAALVRFNADGSVDASYGTGGVAQNPAAAAPSYSSIALQPDGKVLALTFRSLSRHGTDGQLDASFGVNGVVTISSFTPTHVRVQPSGKILVAGTTSGTSVRLARFLDTGAVDASIGGGLGYRDVSGNTGTLFATASPYIPLRLMADGRPILSGAQSTGFGAIVRYGVDLTDDVAVGLEYAQPSSVFVLPDGKLLVSQSGTSTGFVRRLLGDADAATCVGSTTALTSAPNPSAYGQSFTLYASVTLSNGAAPQGSVEFRKGTTSLGTSTSINNGIATLDVSMPEGDSALTAIFTGSGSILNSTSPVHTHTVTPRTPTTTTLSSSPNPSASGQTVTLTATVTPQSGSGTPVGTVQFREGFSALGPVVALSSGTATMTISTLSDGTHSLIAGYSGDSSFAGSTSAPVSHVVPGRLTINDPSVNAAAAATNMNFVVTLTTASASTVTVNYATSDHTAVAGTHYTTTTGMLTFTPGQTSKTVPVPVAQSQPGPSKDFFLLLSSPANASIAKGAGIGTITYATSGTITFYAGDAAVAEGQSGVTLMGFNVSLSNPVNGTVQVSYATADGSAIAGADYTPQSGTLSFPPGVTTRWVMVPIAGNTLVQSNRTLFLNLSNPSFGTLGKAQGTGTIIDDDPAPAAASVAMLRLYSDATKEHLYTTDSNEYAILGTRGWVQEGTAYTMFSNAGSYGPQYAIPLYRMYHGGIQQHHWTTNSFEVMSLASLGSWAYEGIPGYVLPAAGAGSTPLYRLRYPYNPIHLWTIDSYEKDVLSTPQYGWIYEGIVGEVLP